MSDTKTVDPSPAFTLISSGWASNDTHIHVEGGRRGGESKSPGPTFAPGSRLLRTPPTPQTPGKGSGQGALAAPSSFPPSVSTGLVISPRLALTWFAQQGRLACLLMSGGASTAGELERESAGRGKRGEGGQGKEPTDSPWSRLSGQISALPAVI